MSHLEQISDFALSLLRECDQKGSTVLSPLSIGLVLALLHAGANGETKKQIGQALAKGATDEEVQEIFMSFAKAFEKPIIEPDQPLPPVKKGYLLEAPPIKPYKAPKYEASLANRLYVRDGLPIKQSYLDVIKNNYDAVAEMLDFGAKKESAKTMNDFVSEVTKGKILTILNAEMIKNDSVAILVNAVYFKAPWYLLLYLDKTNQRDFFGTGGLARKVQMLWRTMDAMYHETKEVQVLSLPYEDRTFSFEIFLPKENVALETFLAGINGKELQNLVKSTENAEVSITIPMMSNFETELKLTDILKKLGIVNAFDKANADLKNIHENPDPEKNLCAADVFHKTLIEVDEASWREESISLIQGMTLVGCQFPPRTIHVFNANRPFLYTLSKNRAPMFIGIYQ